MRDCQSDGWFVGPLDMRRRSGIRLVSKRVSPAVTSDAIGTLRLHSAFSFELLSDAFAAQRFLCEVGVDRRSRIAIFTLTVGVRRQLFASTCSFTIW